VNCFLFASASEDDSLPTARKKKGGKKAIHLAQGIAFSFWAVGGATFSYQAGEKGGESRRSRLSFQGEGALNGTSIGSWNALFWLSKRGEGGKRRMVALHQRERS